MEWVNFKVKEGERERLKDDAYAHRMNISEYLRFLIEKERKEHRKEDEGNETYTGASAGSLNAFVNVCKKRM